MTMRAMFDIFQNAPRAIPEIRKQLADIENWLGNDFELEAPPREISQDRKRFKRVVDHVYKELDVVDAKVGSLTQASSVLLAIVALNWSTKFLDTNTVAKAMAIVSFTILFLAVLISLSVIFLHWFPVVDASALNNDDGLVNLLKIRNGRSRRYRISWWLTWLGGAALALAFLCADIDPTIREIAAMTRANCWRAETAGEGAGHGRQALLRSTGPSAPMTQHDASGSASRSSAPASNAPR